MPDQHCPVCGTVRTAGSCGCSPDLTETTVLPHIEGPPLVRPYVPQAVSQEATGQPGQSTPPPNYDAFPAAVYATTLMPPVPPAMPPAATHPASAHPAPAHAAAPHRAAPDQTAPDELGLFPFANAPGAGPEHAAGPGAGRAARRAEQRGPLTRRRGAILAAGAGVVLLGVGAAFLAAPSSSGEKTALPIPSLTSIPTVNAPTGAPDTAEPSPQAQATDSASASPSPTRSSRPSASRAATEAPAPATGAPAPPVQAAPATTPAAPSAPTSAPAATSAPAKPSPSSSVPPPTLARDAPNDPAEVKAMQTKLVAVSCGAVDKSIESGTFDWWTQWVLSNYQKQHKITKSEDGIYGPATRAVLEADKAAC